MSAILAIAGSDSIAGAGIQADLKTALDFRVHCATALTAITAQNRDGIRRIDPVPVEGLVAQIEAVLDDLPIAAIKIGMLGTAAHARAVATALEGVTVPVILDPVLRASTGASLLDDPGALAPLIARATLITPNQEEARRLSGDDVAGWLDRVGTAVLLTGGDAPGDEVEDVLFRPGHAPRLWRIEKQPGRFHGTGCTLSSAIACGLALGFSLSEAVDRGIGYVQHLIARSGGSELLPHGEP